LTHQEATVATRTWTGSVSTDWNDPNNWSLFGVPGSADDVVIGTTATSPVLPFSTNVTVNTITINGTDTLTLIGAVLTVTNGVTLSSTGGISGQGTLAAAVTATGAAQISSNSIAPRTLEVTGTITDSGNALVLHPIGFTTLKLDAASAAHAVIFDSLGGGALALGANATLTVGTAMTLHADRQLSLLGPGSTLTDVSGVTLNGSGARCVVGQGTLNAPLSGVGEVLASGGTLHLTGPVASGVQLSVDGSSAGAVLSVENAAISVAPILIDSSLQTLAIGSSGNLTINGGAESITNGTIIISTGGQLSDSSGFIIGSGAALIGSGKVIGPISGTGIVEASGGTLELLSFLPASSGTVFEIANSASSALLLDEPPGTGNTFTFLGANGDLALFNDAGFNDTVSGLNVGIGGAKTNFVDIESHTVTINSVTGRGTTSGTITLSDGAVLHLTNLSSTAWSAQAVGDGAVGTDVFVSSTPAVAVHDFNGDGKADIVLQNDNYGGVWLWDERQCDHRRRQHCHAG
jgi:hypothetical protein